LKKKKEKEKEKNKEIKREKRLEGEVRKQKEKRTTVGCNFVFSFHLGGTHDSRGRFIWGEIKKSYRDPHRDNKSDPD